MSTSICVLLTMMCVIPVHNADRIVTASKRLYHHLLDPGFYSPAIRPVINESTITKVYLCRSTFRWSAFWIIPCEPYVEWSGGCGVMCLNKKNLN